MSLSSVMTTALGGMRAEQTRMTSAAHSIASRGAAVPAPHSTSTQALTTRAEAGLEEQLLELRQAEVGFAANAVVFETGADLWEILAAALDNDPDHR